MDDQDAKTHKIKPDGEESVNEKVGDSAINYAKNKLCNNSSRTNLPQLNTVERGRGRRIFGSIIGTLRKNEAESKEQDVKYTSRRVIENKLAQKLKEERELAQSRYKRNSEVLDDSDISKIIKEKAEQTKKDNMRLYAYNLKTETVDPPIYYRPYTLLPVQEERLNNQIRVTKQDITV